MEILNNIGAPLLVTALIAALVGLNWSRVVSLLASDKNTLPVEPLPPADVATDVDTEAREFAEVRALRVIESRANRSGSPEFKLAVDECKACFFCECEDKKTSAGTKTVVTKKPAPETTA